MFLLDAAAVYPLHMLAHIFTSKLSLNKHEEKNTPNLDNNCRLIGKLPQILGNKLQ
jgi:hypothetical protein